MSRSSCDLTGFHRFPNDSVGLHRIPYYPIGLQRLPQDSIGCHRMQWDAIGFHRASQRSIGLHRVQRGSIGIRRHPKGGPLSWPEHHVLIMRELCGNYAGLISREFYKNPDAFLRMHRNPWEFYGGSYKRFHRISQDSILFHRITTISLGFHRVTWYAMGFHWLPQGSIGLHRVPWGSIGIHRHPKGGPRRWPEHHVLIMRELCGNYAGLQSYIFYRNLCHVHGNPI